MISGTLPPGKKIFKEQKSDEHKFSLTFQLISGEGKKNHFLKTQAIISLQR